MTPETTFHDHKPFLSRTKPTTVNLTTASDLGRWVLGQSQVSQ